MTSGWLWNQGGGQQQKQNVQGKTLHNKKGNHLKPKPRHIAELKLKKNIRFLRCLSFFSCFLAVALKCLFSTELWFDKWEELRTKHVIYSFKWKKKKNPLRGPQFLLFVFTLRASVCGREGGWARAKGKNISASEAARHTVVNSI